MKLKAILPIKLLVTKQLSLLDLLRPLTVTDD